MVNLKKYIPEGTRDILFKEYSAKKQIENKLSEIYIGHGYHEVISPTLEFYDVFNMENQPIPQEKMYKLFDNMGRILVLRPDMTTPIARIAATKIKLPMYPMKLCYNANIFRVNENLNGKLSEFTQSGIEIIGEAGIRADVEAVITGIKALNKINLKDFQIEIGESQYFKYIIEDLNFTEDEKENLRLLIQNKNISALKEFLNSKSKFIDENTTKILEKLPELFGGKEVIDEAKKLTESKNALAALERLKELYEIIESLGMAKYIGVDLGMVQNINYYTGLIFRGYCIGAGDDILSGGRYDNLIKGFGENLPATGFAVNVDSVLKALEVQGASFSNNKIEKLIYCNAEDLRKAYEVLDKFSEDGIIAEISLFDSEEQSIEYGIKIGASTYVNVSKGISCEFKDIEKNKWTEF